MIISRATSWIMLIYSLLFVNILFNKLRERSQSMRKISMLLIVLTTVNGILDLPFLPDNIAFKWTDPLTPRFFVGKYFSVFIFPFKIFTICIIHRLFEHSSNKLHSINHDLATLLMMVFFSLIQTVIILISLNIVNFHFNIFSIITGVVVIILAIPMRTVKMNAIFGLRTTWSMKNDKVWRKSNELGSTLMLIWGMFCLIYSFTFHPQHGYNAIIISLLIF